MRDDALHFGIHMFMNRLTLRNDYCSVCSGVTEFRDYTIKFMYSF